MRYRYLLVDNDDTLMDFAAAEHKALREALSNHGLPHSEDVCESYHHINLALWKALERGETTQARLKIERFGQLIARYQWPDVKAEDLAVTFQAQLSTHADLLPGAMHLIEALQGKMKIALVSNGVSATQRGRLSRCPFAPYLDAVIISEEIGVSKPNPLMVTAALTALGCTDKSEAVFLGDSLTADVAAAQAAGIDSIWLNLHAQTSTLPTHEVHSLPEAESLLLE